MKTNTTTTTAKAVNAAKKAVNAEFKTLNACVKALCEMDNLDNGTRATLRKIGVRKGLTNAQRSEVARTIANNTRYYTTSEGREVVCDKRTRTKEDGTKEAYYIVRTAWTLAKVVDCIKTFKGLKGWERTAVVIE